MENKLLTDPMVKPDGKVLEAALGKNYRLFTEFETKLAAWDLVPEWHYYNDGKSWLGKILYKKKNLCWLSVWNTGFRMTFYFMERHIDGVYDLDISEEIIKAAKEMKNVGKSHPVTVHVKNKKMINDALKIMEYKKGLK